jgi:uncharacterized protein (DUF1330 family)
MSGTEGATASKKAYLLAQIDVTNPDQYAQYAALTPDIVAKFGGRFIARAGRRVTVEGPEAPNRVVVVEFPDYEKAQAFYHSPEYTTVKRLRANAAAGQIVVVEGI